MRKLGVLGFLVMLAFLVTSCTAPSDDDPRVSELQKQVEDLRTENAKLRGEIAKLESETKSSSEAKAKYTRKEFKRLVMGKTRDEVIKAVGRPQSTQEGASSELWYYKKTTYDPIAQKVDHSAQVVLENGVVVRINF